VIDSELLLDKKAELPQRWPTAQCALYMGAL